MPVRHCAWVQCLGTKCERHLRKKIGMHEVSKQLNNSKLTWKLSSYLSLFWYSGKRFSIAFVCSQNRAQRNICMCLHWTKCSILSTKNCKKCILLINQVWTKSLKVDLWTQPVPMLSPHFPFAQAFPAGSLTYRWLWYDYQLHSTRDSLSETTFTRYCWVAPLLYMVQPYPVPLLPSSSKIGPHPAGDYVNVPTHYSLPDDSSLRRAPF